MEVVRGRVLSLSKIRWNDWSRIDSKRVPSGSQVKAPKNASKKILDDLTKMSLIKKTDTFLLLTH